MLRFVILVHDHPFLHWDFLLENGELCRAWRLFSSPESAVEILATEQFDHRLIYLDYEGPVSNQRGTVMQWDHGEFEWHRNEADFCEVTLSGQKWQGKIRLTRIENTRWKLVRVE